MMEWVRSAAYAAVSLISTPVWAVLSLFTFPLPVSRRYRFITLWTRFTLWWLGVSCGLHYRVEGAERIPAGPAIVMAKHQSAWETMALQRVFPEQTWVLKRELLWTPFLGWALALLDPVAINRKAGRRAVEQLVEQGRARLQQGRWLVVFPEGTRVAPGRKGRYRLGGAVLAARSGYPVVPVAHNAGDFWPRRSFRKRAGIIQVVVGEPIETQGLAPEEILRRVETWIEDTMARISPAYPALAPTILPAASNELNNL
ncbi:MAG: 1-acyl-sn-glycerol-3-phosphate acyltransferase [Chromatiales bacterium 21-64-14]|nr:MAG: 1-acyl-sn-glycerol-3-phosphate acyltransferase [Chromatiales bacterium 21-64-14]